MATSPASEPAIVAHDLSKRYGGRIVVSGVSLEVRFGEVVALLGPNGAGKTTTVEVIEGYRPADSGSVRVLGADPWRAGRTHRSRVGLMLQAGGFDMRARPAETLRQFGGFHHDPLPVEPLLDDLGLRTVARTPYRRLSGGERQRLAFAVALVGRPAVLILDEPTAGMDPEARAVVRERILATRDEGRAVLLTSHELTDVERVADRIAVLVGGRIVANGTAAELVSGLSARLRFRLDRSLDPAGLTSLVRSLGAEVVPAVGAAGYEVAGVAPSPDLVARLAAWCAEEGYLITWSQAAGGSLEDAYLELVATAGGLS